MSTEDMGGGIVMNDPFSNALDLLERKQTEVERLREALEKCCTCAAYGPMTVCPACAALDLGRRTP